MNWLDTYNKAIAYGGRLASLAEGKSIMATYGPGYLEDRWVCIGTPTNRDWM